MDPQAPIQEPITPFYPETKPEQPKKGNWITVASVAIFVLLALGAVAFLYLQNQQLKKMIIGYQVQSTPTPTVSADPTANWKTYTNDEYRFSLKYPSDLTIDINKVESANYVQLIFNKSLPDSVSFKASGKYPANQPKYLLDTPSSGAKDVNGNNWSLFSLTNNNSGVQIELNSTLYSLIYPTSKEMLANQILSTFKMLEASPSPLPANY